MRQTLFHGRVRRHNGTRLHCRRKRPFKTACTVSRSYGKYGPYGLYGPQEECTEYTYDDNGRGQSTPSRDSKKATLAAKSGCTGSTGATHNSQGSTASIQWDWDRDQDQDQDQDQGQPASMTRFSPPSALASLRSRFHWSIGTAGPDEDRMSRRAFPRSTGFSYACGPGLAEVVFSGYQEYEGEEHTCNSDMPAALASVRARP